MLATTVAGSGNRLQGESTGAADAQPRHLSNETQQLIDHEIRATVEGGLARARAVLSIDIDEVIVPPSDPLSVTLEAPPTSTTAPLVP